MGVNVDTIILIVHTIYLILVKMSMPQLPSHEIQHRFATWAHRARITVDPAQVCKRISYLGEYSRDTRNQVLVSFHSVESGKESSFMSSKRCGVVNVHLSAGSVGPPWVCLATSPARDAIGVFRFFSFGTLASHLLVTMAAAAPGGPGGDPVVIQIRCVGGVAAGGATLAPRLGPLGLSAKKVGDDIAKETMPYKGLKVTVKLIIQNRQAAITVVPTASMLLIQALNEPERDRKKEKNIKHSGNLSMEQIYKVARTLRPRSRAKEFSGTVREMLGTCVSIGCTVNDTNPQDLIESIKSGELVVPEE
eukprot:g77960.t1